MILLRLSSIRLIVSLLIAITYASTLHAKSEGMKQISLLSA